MLNSYRYLTFLFVLSLCSCKSSGDSTGQRIDELAQEAADYVLQMNQAQQYYFERQGKFFPKKPEIPSISISSLKAGFHLELKKCYTFRTIIEENVAFNYAEQYQCNGFWGFDLDESIGGVFVVDSKPNNQPKIILIVCRQHPLDYGVAKPILKNGVAICPRSL